VTQLASDDFNRANASDLGANWAGTDFDITSNEAQVNPALSSNLYSAVTCPDDGYVEIEIGVLETASDNGVGPLCRAAGNGDTLRGYFAQANAQDLHLYKIETGAAFTLLDSTTGCAQGDIIRITFVGSLISVQKNGVTVISSVSDSTFTSGAAGMWGAVGAVAAASVNNFAFGNLTGGGSPYTLTAGSGTYAVTGQSTTLTYTPTGSYTLTAGSGSYAITGSDALRDISIVMSGGSYSLGGQALSFIKGYRISCTNGSYSINGRPATLTYSGATPIIISAGGSHVLKVPNVLVVSAVGRTKWVNYLPVKQVTPGASSTNTFNNDGAIGVSILSSGSGLTEWVDYIPVVEVSDPDSGRWHTDNTGFIPIVEIT